MNKRKSSYVDEVALVISSKRQNLPRGSGAMPLKDNQISSEISGELITVTDRKLEPNNQNNRQEHERYLVSEPNV